MAQTILEVTDVSQFGKLFTDLDTQKADSAVCTSLLVATSVAFWLAGSAALEGDASKRGFHATAGSASVRAEVSFPAAFGPNWRVRASNNNRVRVNGA